jgi:hypothetical protein
MRAIRTSFPTVFGELALLYLIRHGFRRATFPNGEGFVQKENQSALSLSENC